ncbi:GGDEF domain-containing protein [Streptomyces sp. 110]|uniref:GGDEF domain-containing protein n=1 Tax=Streptomyces endocoffeicus TaxID=2898945 RepID=A0ABS1PU22_9ACTN|nr:GGDEF domain-containing protein [Streptomyces endocoffeicus]MBL1115480.1 GGDEF domain-containing protein [Streptomyces endocoffeicus]
MDTRVLTVLLAVGWAVHAAFLTHRLGFARRDPLTKLLTRDWWEVRARRIIRRHPNAVVVMLDLDDLKVLNDTFGHEAGDTALVAVAERLTAWCGTAGVAARVGGDEFVAVITDPNATSGLPALTAVLQQPLSYDEQTVPLAASVGACHVADLPARALTHALKAADLAMYSVKGHSRRNR